MATVIMRNRVTTEYRKVEKDSDEFYSLRAELHTDGRPRWEQTGEHDAAAFKSRVDAGAVRDSDIGDAGQPATIDTAGAPDTRPQLDIGYPTPGEIEQGAGRAADMNEEDFGAIATARTGGVNEGYPAGHPPQEVGTEGSAERGISDDPAVEIGSEDTDTTDEVPYEDRRIADLRTLADQRGLTVERSDGTGDPRKSDYVEALYASDENPQPEEGSGTGEEETS